MLTNYTNAPYDDFGIIEGGRWGRKGAMSLHFVSLRLGVKWFWDETPDFHAKAPRRKEDFLNTQLELLSRPGTGCACYTPLAILIFIDCSRLKPSK